MTTREERARRPDPPRTRPRRGALNALHQVDPRPAPDAGGHPLGPGFNDVQGGHPTSEQGDRVIAETVQAASDLIDRHIAEGKAAAAGLRRGTTATTTADLPLLVNRLVRGYSDMASVWVELVTAVTKREPQTRPEDPPAPTIMIVAPRPVTASAQMTRPGPLRPEPLLGPEGASLRDVAFADGVLTVTVPEETPSGAYHGVLLGDDGAPSGILSVTVP